MDDINPALRSELEAALVVLDPQLRGLYDLALVSISQALKTEVGEQIREREDRRALINAVLSAMDATNGAYAQLLSDGYPALPDDIISPALMDELKEEMADLAAAEAVFQESHQATTMVVKLGEPEAKPPEGV